MAQEKLFENRIKKFLQSHGIYPLGTPIQKMKVSPIGYYEKRWGNKMVASGLPDMHIVICNMSIDVEIKAPNGRASELQKRMVEQINDSQCAGCVLYEHQENIPDDGFEYYINYEQFKDTIQWYISRGVIGAGQSQQD